MITSDIYIARWKLFGHILRGAPNAPAYRAMREYFTNPHGYSQRRGRKPTSLPTQLNHDLRSIGRRLLTIADLNSLTEIAQDRTAWRALWRPIVQHHANNIRVRDARKRVARQQRRHYRTREYIALDGQRRRLTLTINSPQVIRIPRQLNNAVEDLNAGNDEEVDAQEATLADAIANLNLNPLFATE